MHVETLFHLLIALETPLQVPLMALEELKPPPVQQAPLEVRALFIPMTQNVIAKRLSMLLMKQEQHFVMP